MRPVRTRTARSSAGESDGDADATTFTWDIFALAGDPVEPEATGSTAGGNITG